MTVTITRKAAVLLLAALALAVTGTATAGKVKQMFTGANVVNGSLTGLDIKKASLGGALIKKNTLLASHFKAGQLPAGPQGPQGPQGAQGAQGPQGSPGLAGREIVSASTITSSSNTKFLVLACPAGKVALGGGGQVLYPAGNWAGSEVALSSSLPNGSGWVVRAIEAGAVAAPGTWQLEGHVVCAAVAA
ncbi:MAG TPA: hypothetical protein VHH57_05720 [Gaiella sp.]|jgi:hypothetical protein|nr:hypothetical protein [Gaiella sp.]